MMEYFIGVVIALILITAIATYLVMAHKELQDIDGIGVMALFAFICTILSWVFVLVVAVVGTSYPVIKYILKKKKGISND